MAPDGPDITPATPHSDSSHIAEARRLAEEYADHARPHQSEKRQFIAIPGYELVRELRSGGQGTVYLAIQLQTRREVAIKVMHARAFAGIKDRHRFKREVRALAQLDHPNIVRIHDAGEADGRSYYVMDYVPGMSIAEFVGERKLGVHSILKLFQGVCEGVASAHQKGLIHRDLKPANILVDVLTGEPKILDFGLVKLTGDSSVGALGASLVETATETGQFLGSLQWAAPEQVEGGSERIDVRTDVHALGLILYFLLTSRLPYDVIGPIREVTERIARAEPIRPSTIRRDIDTDLDTILLKCLAKDPARRYESAAQLARDISHYVAGEAIDARRDSTWYVISKELKRHRAAAGVGLLLFTLLLGFAVYATVQARSEAALKERERRLAYRRSVSLAAELLERGEMRRAKQRLAECPADLRNWEWFWLHGESDRSVHELKNGRQREFDQVAIDRSGTRVFAGSTDGTISIWDLAPTGPPLVLAGPAVVIQSIALVTDERIASRYDNGEVWIWDIAGGTPSVRLRAGMQPAEAVAVCPDKHLLATSSNGIILWDSETGAKLQDIAEVLPGRARYMAFSSDCSELWFNNGLHTLVRTRIEDNSQQAYDLPEDVELFSLSPGSSESPFVVGQTSEGGLCWTEQVAEAPPAWVCAETRFEGLLGSATRSPDGMFVASSSDKAILLWNAATGALVARLRGHEMGVKHLTFSTDGRLLASASHDFTVRVWNVEEVVKDAEASITVNGVAQPGNTRTEVGLRSFALSGDGARVAVGQSDGFVSFIDVKSGNVMATLENPTTYSEYQAGADVGSVGTGLRGLALSPDGVWAAVGYSDQSVALWAQEGGVLQWIRPLPDDGTLDLREWKEDGQRPVTVAFSPDSRMIAAAGIRGTIHLLSIQNGAMVRSFVGHEGPVRSIAFDASGARLFSGSLDGTVRVWDLTSNGSDPCVRTLPHGNYVYSIAWTPEPAPAGRLVSAGDTYFWPIRIWDLATGACIHELLGQDAATYAVTFSPDGSRVAAAGCDQYVRLWDAESGDHLLDLRPPSEPGYSSIAFTPQPASQSMLLVQSGLGTFAFRP